ncbi:PepSY-associated TM helix domain-containing protein [Ancylomarina sp. YFZ004]
MRSKQYWYRLLHRDFGYFYVGLILCFSISGIALNHRDIFNAQTYVVRNEPIQLENIDSLSISPESYIKNISPSITNNKFRGVRMNKNEARVYFEDAFANIDLLTGKGEIEYIETIPVLGHMSILHKLMNKWWVWFSDIFALALILISITGILLSKGKYSFKKRGWILTVSGLLFPVIILFFM